MNIKKHICITKSLCCTEEINTTLQINYSSIKKKKDKVHLFDPLKIGFPDGSVGKESARNAGDTGDMGSILGLRGSLGGENSNPFLSGKSHKQRNLVGYGQKGGKESDTTEHNHII